MSDPTGVGVYLRELSTVGTPKAVAKRARDNGVRFVALLACWQDGAGHKARNRKLLPAFAEELARVGVLPWIWGYPHAGLEERFVERMREAAAAPVAGWILDPEVSYKKKPAAAQKLVDLTTDALTERLGLGVTSYGLAKAHPTFPWKTFGGRGWGSPQLYDVAPAQIDRGIAEWRAHGWEHVVPSVPSFGPKSGAKLHDFLSHFVDGKEDVAGFVVWSWTQTSSDEWRVLARWADWFERGIPHV